MARPLSGVRMVALAKFLTVVAWLLTAALPTEVLFMLDVDFRSSSGADTSFFALPMIWLACIGLSGPWFGRVYAGLTDYPPRRFVRQPPRSLPHLPRPLVRLVVEAEAIRRDLGPRRFDPALLRAWELANTVDALPPDLRFTLDETGATLEPVRALVVLRASDSRVPLARQLAHLDAALAAFLRATVTPAGGSFRGGAAPSG